MSVWMVGVYLTVRHVKKVSLTLRLYCTEPGGSECECYVDTENGHWTGASCDECLDGWGLPDCKTCKGLPDCKTCKEG